MYTPQTGWRSIQIIKSSKLCTGFSFLEEGLYSYCSRGEMERRHRGLDSAAVQGHVRSCDTLNFGGMLRHRCTRSAIACSSTSSLGHTARGRGLRLVLNINHCL